MNNKMEFLVAYLIHHGLLAPSVNSVTITFNQGQSEQFSCMYVLVSSKPLGGGAAASSQNR